MIEINDRDLHVLRAEDPGNLAVAFADMIRDPGYRAVSHLRSEAVVETVLQPTTPIAI